MKFLRQRLLVSAFVLFCVCAGGFAAEPPKSAFSSPSPASSVASIPVLPPEFSGWQVKGAVEHSGDPAVADAVNVPVLKEYGFVRLERAAYTRDDGRNLTIRAMVFEDTSGAY